MKNNNYKPSEFTEFLNVSIGTLQRWDNDGKLKAYRTPTNRRYYTYEQYLEYKGITNNEIKRKNIIYTRVSTSNQKDNLKNQINFLRQFTNAKLKKYKKKIEKDDEIEKSLQDRN